MCINSSNTDVCREYLSPEFLRNVALHFLKTRSGVLARGIATLEVLMSVGYIKLAERAGDIDASATPLRYAWSIATNAIRTFVVAECRGLTVRQFHTSPDIKVERSPVALDNIIKPDERDEDNFASPPCIRDILDKLDTRERQLVETWLRERGSWLRTARALCLGRTKVRNRILAIVRRLATDGAACAEVFTQDARTAEAQRRRFEKERERQRLESLVVHLRREGKHSQRAIALQLGTTEGIVRSILCRAGLATEGTKRPDVLYWRGNAWRKFYRGRCYGVSCSTLGVPPTRAESYEAALAWWRRKKQELDGADTGAA